MKGLKKLYLGGNQPTSPRHRLSNCKRRCRSATSSTASSSDFPNAPTAFTPEPVRRRVAGMKQMLLMITVVALVGCGKPKTGLEAIKLDSPKATTKKNEGVAWVSNPSDPQNVIVENIIRAWLKKPKGELTKADLDKLTVLNLWQNEKITDAGLKELAKLENLTGLGLGVTQITDAGLKELANLKRLTSLKLMLTPITDAGLKEVAKLQNLTELNLSSTEITDVGLKEIAKLKKLDQLHLDDTEITDAGLKELAKLRQLTYLSLAATKITDTGLKEVAKWKQVTSIALEGTKVTKAGVAELQKALPKCGIFHNATK
jgi:hypothetical protein